MRLWRWKRRLAREIVVNESEVRVSGSESIGAGGDVRGNAIGQGSSTTHIEQIVVNPLTTLGEQRRRQIAPPPIGAIADRKAIREALLQSALLTPAHLRRAPVVFLEGYGGGGKTTTALQLCHLSEPRSASRAV